MHNVFFVLYIGEHGPDMHARWVSHLVSKENQVLTICMPRVSTQQIYRYFMKKINISINIGNIRNNASLYVVNIVTLRLTSIIEYIRNYSQTFLQGSIIHRGD